jgi:pimeloyl-ACP methyl ester carboxylesterase
MVDDKPEVNLDMPRGAYLDKPTFIMCNPNALLYQQMVSSPNAYWLTFFLRREINVMCWNYRSYGKSKNPNRCCLGFCDAIDPLNIKLDSEKILDFVVKKLKVQGKIGVYGRSLGGIASCHLAQKYPNLISALIVDRTFSELDVSSERRLFGSWSKLLYRFVSLNWKAQNDVNYIKAARCFKIATCDPLDDVIDNFSSLPIGVAEKIAR